MKKWHKCSRCQEEFESLYLVPYLTTQFINVTICRKCSMEFYKQIEKFTEDFLFKQNK